MKKTVTSENTYIRLLGYLRLYWYKSAIILILSAVSAYITVLPTQILGIAVDEIRIADTFIKAPIISPSDGKLPNKTTPHEQKNPIPLSKPLLHASHYVHKHWFEGYNSTIVTLVFLAVSFIGMHVFHSVIMLTHGFLTSELGQRLIYDMRNQLYDDIQRFPLKYFENTKTGDIMSRLMNDVNSLEQAIVGPVISFITDMFKFGWILYFCLKLDWQLTSIALGICPFISLCTYNFGKRIRKIFRSLRAGSDIPHRHLTKDPVGATYTCPGRCPHPRRNSGIMSVLESHLTHERGRRTTHVRPTHGVEARPEGA